MSKPMVLTVSGAGCGAYPTSWRHTQAPSAPSLSWFRAITAHAERGGLDAILFADPAWPGTGPGETGAFVIDPLPLIAALAASSTTIGLAAQVPTQWSEPFNIARSFAGLDRLTAGRSAWIAPVIGPAQRPADFAHTALTKDPYAQAAECIEVVRKLWDSWEDEAVLLDKPAGLFNDPHRIHRIHHAGPFFSVLGPLNAPRPLQGHPPLFQSDASPPGLALARATADIFIATVSTPDALAGLRQALGPTPLLLATVVPVLAPTQSQADERAAAMDADKVDGIRFAGTPPAFAAFLADLFAAAACDGFHIAPAVLPDDLVLLTDHVVPLLQQRGLRPVHQPAATLRDRLGLPRPSSQFAA